MSSNSDIATSLKNYIRNCIIDLYGATINLTDKSGNKITSTTAIITNQDIVGSGRHGYVPASVVGIEDDGCTPSPLTNCPEWPAYTIVDGVEWTRPANGAWVKSTQTPLSKTQDQVFTPEILAGLSAATGTAITVPSLTGNELAALPVGQWITVIDEQFCVENYSSCRCVSVHVDTRMQFSLKAQAENELTIDYQGNGGLNSSRCPLSTCGEIPKVSPSGYYDRCFEISPQTSYKLGEIGGAEDNRCHRFRLRFRLEKPWSLTGDPEIDSASALKFGTARYSAFYSIQ